MSYCSTKPRPRDPSDEISSPKPSKPFRKAYRQALAIGSSSRTKQSVRTWARHMLRALKGGRS